jgi:hypothetical protein
MHRLSRRLVLPVVFTYAGPPGNFGGGEQLLRVILSPLRLLTDCSDYTTFSSIVQPKCCVFCHFSRVEIFESTQRGGNTLFRLNSVSLLWAVALLWISSVSIRVNTDPMKCFRSTTHIESFWVSSFKRLMLPMITYLEPWP